MRAPILVAVAVAALVLPASATSDAASARSHVLAALADQGTVYWRSGCPKEWSLGFHIWPRTPTAEITFRAGKRTVRRTLQPGEPTVWFRFRSDRAKLTVVSGGEAETIYSLVRVRFDERHSLSNCWVYAPPRVNTSLYGRDHFG